MGGGIFDRHCGGSRYESHDQTSDWPFDHDVSQVVDHFVADFRLRFLRLLQGPGSEGLRV